ncbi:zf-HC2 domain-containing protein [Clostridium sp. DL-VIII]|nr:zf-HC2 domain-containing protein [Clostridium sp. DL-VIII]
MKCEIIRDLLPLYIDTTCSKKSTILVEEHLQNCI